MKHPTSVIALLLSLAMLLSTVSSAMADVSEGDLRDFVKGKTTLDEVVAKFGQPSKIEYNDEGLRGIAYLDQSTHSNADPTISIFSSLAALSVSGRTGPTISGASLALGTVGGADSNSAITAFAFDKNGLLMYYRAVVSTASANTFGSDSSSKVITSEDGAAPMPKVKLALTDDQRKQLPVALTDDKPVLGISCGAISALSEKSRNEFAAAKFDGLIVVYVRDGSPGQKAGIQLNDYVYVVNGMLVNSTETLKYAMSTVSKGDTVRVRAKRIDYNANLWREQIFTVHF